MIDDHDYEHEQNVNYWLIVLILAVGITIGITIGWLIS